MDGRQGFQLAGLEDEHGRSPFGHLGLAVEDDDVLAGHPTRREDSPGGDPHFRSDHDRPFLHWDTLLYLIYTVVSVMQARI